MSHGLILYATRRSIGLLCILLVLVGRCVPAGATGGQKKEKSPRKGSEAIRQNPLIRGFFRQRAMSMQPTLKENDRTLNSTVDFLMDDFVERSIKLAKKLSEESDALYTLAPNFLETESHPVKVDRGMLDTARTKAEVLKSTTKSLEGQMDFLVEVLRLTIKVNEADGSTLELKQIGEDINRIHDLVATFRVSLNEFLFPKSNTVALVDMQKASLPVQLKKIERYAERIELAAKRMRSNSP